MRKVAVLDDLMKVGEALPAELVAAMYTCIADQKGFNMADIRSLPPTAHVIASTGTVLAMEFGIRFLYDDLPVLLNSAVAAGTSLRVLFYGLSTLCLLHHQSPQRS